tara:strand:+ start:496 stop:675 length:180 start_codon:yes stop_codon:yes gene_type:complete
MYSGCPGFKYSENSCKPPNPSIFPNHEDKEAGKRRKVLAKIAGMTPDMFNFSGRKLDGA